MADTIFALSSGAPPAAIAIVRISGPRASEALLSLTRRLPPPRRAARQQLRSPDGELLDDALVLWFPAPASATGEDVVEIHCHGGRAVIAAIESALAALPGLQRASPGEFTRRAFAHGKLDLAEAEGLGDLLAAETELQRRSALAMASGAFSARVENWRERLLLASALIEAVLDFSDEDDVGQLPPHFAEQLNELEEEMAEWLARPRAQSLRDGFRVVIAGPPNVGKSSLFNALVESEAAITTPIAGTTRDVLTRPIAIDGIPFTLVDTAGVHEHALDPVEVIGIGKARAEAAEADLVLWLGDEGRGPDRSWEIEPRSDRVERPAKQSPRHRVSSVTGAGLVALRRDLVSAARGAMPRLGEPALNARQHHLLSEARSVLVGVAELSDSLLAAEHLRLARVALDSLVGRTATEDLLDVLFSRFCIGK